MAKTVQSIIRCFFSIKLNEKSKQNQERNVLYIRGNNVTYVEFNTLQPYNFVKSELNAKKLCSKVFLHKIENTP